MGELRLRWGDGNDDARLQQVRRSGVHSAKCKGLVRQLPSGNHNQMTSCPTIFHITGAAIYSSTDLMCD